MHHILGHISAREFPEQPPVNEFVGIEFAVGSTVEERFPIDILRRTVGGHRARPLALSVGRIAAHPRLHLGHLTDNSILDPLSCIGQRARALMLQSNLNYSVGFLRRRQTPLRLWNGPSHGLL